jgi:hypothetical protein
VVEEEKRATLKPSTIRRNLEKRAHSICANWENKKGNVNLTAAEEAESPHADLKKSQSGSLPFPSTLSWTDKARPSVLNDYLSSDDAGTVPLSPTEILAAELSN